MSFPVPSLLFQINNNNNIILDNNIPNSDTLYLGNTRLQRLKSMHIVDNVGLGCGNCFGYSSPISPHQVESPRQVTREPSWKYLPTLIRTNHTK